MRDREGQTACPQGARGLRALMLALALLAGAPGHADQPGRFDYYVLALSWSPNWCRMTGDDRQAAQCDPGGGADFTLHGLWPQHERGWPSDCVTPARDPSRRETAAQADLFGSGGQAWYQWRKHGRCSGLSAADYFRTARTALDRIRLPEHFEGLDRDISIPPALIERAFLLANPDMRADGVTVTCKRDDLAEIRICLTRELTPRACGADISRDCSRDAIRMDRVR